MRHRRGALSKEIKSALFKVLKIPAIKSNAGSKIGEWKKSSCVIKAYSNIWEADDNSLININKIMFGFASHYYSTTHVICLPIDYFSRHCVTSCSKFIARLTKPK